MENYPPAGAPPVAPKKSKAPWLIAGGIGCVVILVLLVVLILGGAYFVKKNVTSTQATNVPTATQAAGTKQYVNSRDKVSGKLADNFVDFSFYYPETWVLDDDPAPNFVRVERKLEGEGDLHGTAENFAVGWVSATGTAFDKQLMPQLAKQFDTQFSTQFPNYHKVSEGETKIGAYEGYEFRFTAKKGNTPDQNVEFWGRVVFLPPPSGQTKGVALVMLATKLAPEVTGVEDVGEKGELPVILDSFRFGSDAKK